MDLACVDEIANDNNGVTILLVLQDLFDRIVDTQEWKQRIPQKRFVHFWLYSQKKNQRAKNWVDKGTKSAGEFKKLCEAEGIQVYTSKSETKAAFAERAIRSLEKILYR